MEKYTKTRQFFSLDEEDEISQRAASALHRARSTLACGEMLSFLLEEEDKGKKRKGCKDQRKLVEKHGLQVPLVLKERARQAELMKSLDT